MPHGSTATELTFCQQSYTFPHKQNLSHQTLSPYVSTYEKAPVSENKRPWVASFQIILPVALTVALFAFSIYFIFIPSLERQLMAQKRSMLRNLTDSVLSLLEEYDQTAFCGIR